ncbi:MAG: T9SS type A sorting domain-containing protein, partial [Salibacteraceae bacterium]
EGDGIYDMEFYNGELYVGGNFNHWDLGINSVAKWNGTSWEALANGIVGTASAVNDLYVHDGLLYAGGLFSEPFGNPGTAVVAWNGTTWESPGSGLGGLSFPRVNKMIEYSGKLYAVGAFLEASGIDASMLASWDGLRWCTHGYSLDNEIFTIEHFRDTLVIGGAFRTIDVDSFPYIAAWDGGEFDFECSAPTGPKDLPSASELELSAYPNPAVDWLHLKLGAGVFTPGGYEVRLLTVDGRLLSESNWTTGRVHSVSLDALPAGFYIVAVQGAGQRWTRKVSVK